MDKFESEGSLTIATTFQRLSRLRQELQTIPNKDKEAFNRAHAINPDATDDESFRLLFIRAEQKAKKAASRLVGHFQHKLELFGANRLTKQLNISDLGLDDLQPLKSGGLELFLAKDSSRRSVVVFNYSRMKYKENDNMIRAFWYMLVSALENIQVQEYGVVVVGSAVNKDDTYFDPQSVDQDLFKQLARCASSVPVRIRSVHSCSRVGADLDPFTDILAQQAGVEVDGHHGNYRECVRQLIAQGIPSDIFALAHHQSADGGVAVPGMRHPSQGQDNLTGDVKQPAPMNDATPLSGLNLVVQTPPSKTQQQARIPLVPQPFGLDNQDPLYLTRLKAIQSLLGSPTGVFPNLNSSTRDSSSSLLGLPGPGQGAAEARMPTATRQQGEVGTQILALLESLQTQAATASSPQILGLAGLTARRPPVVGMQTPQDLAQLQTEGQCASHANDLAQLLTSSLRSNYSAAQRPDPAPIDSELPGSNPDLASLLGAVHKMPRGPSQRIGPAAVHAERQPGQGSFLAQPMGDPEARDNPLLRDGMSPSQAVQAPQHGGAGNHAQTEMKGGKGERKPILDHPPICLYIESDSNSISGYQCLARQQIEMFAATEDDVQFNTSKMNKSIIVGQVGIRCRHCAILPQYSRPKAAVYYPRTLDSLYQFGQNMVKNHLCKACKLIPEETKRKMEDLREERRRGRGGREHWAAAAGALGVYEDASGLRFGTV